MSRTKMKPYPLAGDLLRPILRLAIPRPAPDMRRQFPCLWAALAYRLVAECGLSLAETTRHLGVSMLAITKILRKTDGVAS